MVTIFINKEVQRVSRASLKALNQRDVILTFPENSVSTKTVRVLKSPKTVSSIRKVFLPNSVAENLRKWKKQQEDVKEILGPEYQDFNLVMATSFGLPISDCNIRDRMNKLIKEHDLPPVVFHSLRHTSVTYKLKLNGGDIKSVQGDSGHSQVNMVTEVYSYIIDEDRRHNAELFEEAFYKKKNLDPSIHGTRERLENRSGSNGKTIELPDGVNAESLMKVLGNPEMMNLLASLAKTME